MKSFILQAVEVAFMMKILQWGMVLSMMVGPLWLKAQEVENPPRIFKPFKVDVGINLTFPANTDLTFGGGFFVEPKYGINDQLHVGLHLGSNIIGEGQFVFHNTAAVTKAQAIGNVSLTGDYVFTAENVRPSLGITVGMYRRSDYEIIDENNGMLILHQATHVNFGLAPRMGLIAGKFRMDASFHFTGKGITDFLTIGLGMQFGGGRIKYPKSLP